jgi:hypothetical protein
LPVLHSKFYSAAFVWSLGLAIVSSSGATAAGEPAAPIDLKVRPRVCTLSGSEAACNTTVHAEWRAERDESLCLLILNHPEVRHCWENHARGVYSVEISFGEDLVVQLRDPELEHVLASQTITVIRQALQLRRKRRQPWNIFS